MSKTINDGFFRFFIYDKSEKLICIFRPKYNYRYLEFVGEKVFGTKKKFNNWYTRHLFFYDKKPCEMSNEEAFSLMMQIEYGIYA